MIIVNLLNNSRPLWGKTTRGRYMFDKILLYYGKESITWSAMTMINLDRC